MSTEQNNVNQITDEDILTEPLVNIETKYEELVKINDELKDKLLRSLAENENIRRRSDRQIEEAANYAIINFAKDIISITDDIARAVEYKTENYTEEDIINSIKGIEMIQQNFYQILIKNNIEVIKPQIGNKFDYNFHHAIARKESESYTTDQIIEIMQLGYKIKDRLLRPAMVVVAT